MKFLIFILFTFSTSSFAQNDTIYAFLTSNNKIVQFLYNKPDSVFTYQFISNGKVELEVRDDLKDTDTIFTVEGYHRSGGCTNAALSWNDVEFSNGGYDYSIYYSWSVDESKCIDNPDEAMDNPPYYGIRVSKNEKSIVDLLGKKVLIGEVYGWSFFDILPNRSE